MSIFLNEQVVELIFLKLICVLFYVGSSVMSIFLNEQVEELVFMTHFCKKFLPTLHFPIY